MSNQPAEVWTIGKLLSWTEQFLHQKGLESPRLDAQILLAHAINCTRIDLYVNSEQPTEEGERTCFRELVKRRVAGEPVAYLVGHREFYKLTFRVTPDVLIPRPETEILVLEALDRLKGRDAPTMLDLGTGSGCIAISIAHQHPTIEVTAIDRSPAALDIARQNAEQHGVADRIRLLEGNLYEPLDAEARFGLIVSNPPYVTTDELAHLAPEVRDQEPRLALDGGTDGLDVLRPLIDTAPTWLEPDGYLMVEIGYQQGEAVRERFIATGFLDVIVLKDGAGHSRVVQGRRG